MGQVRPASLRSRRDGGGKGAPVTEEGAAEDLRVNLAGVSPEFAVRLSPEDLEDIAAGDIPLGTVQVFEEAAIAREAEDLKEFFQERAAILECAAGLPRARGRAGGGRDLRGLRPGYPALLAPVPDKPGPVDVLPLGGSTHGRRAQGPTRAAAGGRSAGRRR